MAEQKRTVGVRLYINLSNIKKEKIKTNAKGEKTIDLTAFINFDELDKYGNHGAIINPTEQGEKKEYCGNASIFWSQSINYIERPKKEFNQGFDSVKDDAPWEDF